MRPLSITLVVLSLACAPVALAESSTASGTTTGSGTNVWNVRSARAQGFEEQWSAFAPVFASWLSKWEKTSAKQASQRSRCALDIRSANRDTLPLVTLQCYKGQLLLEQESLKRERETVTRWPGLPQAVKTEHLQSIDALLGALTPILDGIDAKVFTTLAAFKDVRANLLTQYRQPYWLSATHLRAEALQTWVAYLLLDLRALGKDATVASAAQIKVQEALTCYEQAERDFAAASAVITVAEAHAAFVQAQNQLSLCPAIVHSAADLRQQSSSSSSSSR